MDNLTHSLVGLTASKAGLERLSPHATLVSVLAANAPDSDIVVLLFGDRWTFLQHHRGITHSISGTLVLGLALPLIFWVLERLITRLRGRQPTIKLKGLVLVSIVVGATHPILDWTNNYGVRPFLPWSSQWLYGDFIFIVDPFMWLVLGGAAFLLTSSTRFQKICWLLLAAVLSYLVLAIPAQRGLDNTLVLQVCWILVMIALVISFKLKAAGRWGPRIAVAAFGLIAVYWGSLAFLHMIAVSETRRRGLAIASQNIESVTDVAAMPTLATPHRWVCVVETERASYRFELSLVGREAGLSRYVRQERADTTDYPAVERAKQDRRAQIFFGFARFPVARVIDQECLSQTLVQFADLRYTEPGSARGTFSLEVPVDCPIEEVARAK